jgi:uncharacterized protein YrrD
VIERSIMELFRILRDQLASYGLGYMLEGKEVVDPSGDILGIVRNVIFKPGDHKQVLIIHEDDNCDNAFIAADEIASINGRIILS